jgi:molybdopterin converting factor small subunit
MSLTERQIEEYRRKLDDSKYMKQAINKIAGIDESFSTGDTIVILPYVEPKIENTEEKEMAKNSLYDLADHLFERIEWLKDRDDMKGEKLDEEIKRTEAVIKASEQIVQITNTFIKAKMVVDNASGKIKLPAMLEDKTK